MTTELDVAVAAFVRPYKSDVDKREWREDILRVLEALGINPNAPAGTNMHRYQNFDTVCNLGINTISGLADQQAMHDGWYEESSTRLKNLRDQRNGY